MMGLIILILSTVLIIKAAIMLSIETIIGIIGILIAIPIATKLFDLLNEITFKGWAKIAAWSSGLYGLIWCWNALPN